jgi:hypothetical protein
VRKELTIERQESGKAANIGTIEEQSERLAGSIEGKARQTER